jgi:CO/xanthine dehydrogenase FAD-binding subunit
MYLSAAVSSGICPMYILRPASVAQAHQAKSAPGSGSTYAAGGTALRLSWGETPPPALTLIDVAPLLGTDITQDFDSGGLRIGCGIKLEALRRDPLIRKQAPLLAAACDELASLSVRNLATLGGNIGWRFGDTLAPLLAMRAAVELHNGDRVLLNILMSNQECPLIVAVHLPAHALTGPADTASSVSTGFIGFYEKVGRRAAFTPSRIAIALRANLLEGGRLGDVCIAATGAGLVARMLAQTCRIMESLSAHSVTPDVIRDACRCDLPENPALARIASRVISGHVREMTTKGDRPSIAA